MLKKDPANKNESIETNWMHAVEGKLIVEENGDVAFVQEPADGSGRILAPFSNLLIE